MRTLLIALLLACNGCIIAVKDDGSSADQPPPPPPPPPPGTRVVVLEPASDSFALRYRTDVPVVYDGVKKACARFNFKLTDARTPGSDHWSVKGYHASGAYELHISLDRRDHRSYTNVTVQSGRASQFQCREWTRKIQLEIGKQIGEDGKE